MQPPWKLCMTCISTMLRSASTLMEADMGVSLPWGFVFTNLEGSASLMIGLITNVKRTYKKHLLEL